MDSLKAKKDAQKKRKEEADMEVFIRFFDTFSRTMDGIRKSLGEIQGNIESFDGAVFHGMGTVEDKVITQGLNEGASRGGIYGVSDILFNPNIQEYLGVNKDGDILRFDWAGNTLPSLKPPNKPFLRFIHCAPVSIYICWMPRKSSFFLAKEDWTVLIDAVAIAPIGDIIFSGRKADDAFDFFIVSGATLNRYSYTPSTNLISLQDAMTLSDIEADGSVIDLTCFDDPKDDRKQWIYCTSGMNCTIIDVTGRVHGTKRNLHPHKITAITAAGGSDFVVTGDDKGLLKLWGQRWAYLGEALAHTGRITHVIEHPDTSIRASVSFGKDQKLFVFSFDTMKGVETLALPETAMRVVVNNKQKGFLTQGARKIVMWRMNSLLWLRQKTTGQVVRMLLSADNGSPRQVVTLCSNNTVHVLNAATGQGITTALIHPIEPTLRSIAYRRHLDGDTLFALVESDLMLELQHFDCRSNPAQLKTTWDETKWNVGITCVAFYEFNPRITVKEKELAFIKRRKAKKIPKSFLICGRRDGCVVVVDFETGDMDCVNQGHAANVTFIEIDHEINQAISLGILPSLRLWKICQSEDGLLEPLMDITWKSHPITIATILRNMIAFALEHNDNAQHNMVIFNTSVAQKFEHAPENGHKMNIVSISACRELFLFCTASLDGTIALRGPKNELYRVIVLNAIPTCAAFCTRQADILVGIDTGIYVLPADRYLTVLPRNRATSSNLSPGEAEARIPLSARTVRDHRFLTSDEQQVDFSPFPVVSQVVAAADSQEARDLERLRQINDDIQKIIIGKHPLDETIPDYHNMTKQQWDDLGKSVYGDDGENRKFFASEARMAAMVKMQTAASDLDNFGNIE